MSGSDNANGDAPAGVNVFVGNLSFETKEAGLQEAFAKAGLVKGAKIVMRGPRSLGYGFVEMENAEAAKQAVALFDKQELDNRQLNVQLANKREPKPAAAKSGDAKGAKGDGEKKAEGEEKGEKQSRPARRGRGGGRGRGRGGAARQPREQVEKTPSDTTLFIGNLPFKATDEDLSKLFDGLNLKSARVMTRPNGASKGYGFAEFANKDDQQKALEKVGTPQLEERELAVRIAMKEQPSKAKEAAPAAAE